MVNYRSFLIRLWLRRPFFSGIAVVSVELVLLSLGGLGCLFFVIVINTECLNFALLGATAAVGTTAVGPIGG